MKKVRDEKYEQFLRLVKTAETNIHVSTLCEILDVPDSVVRKFRAKAQLEGHPIASGNFGYCYEKGKMKETYKNYTNRAITLLTIVSKNKRFDINQFVIDFNKARYAHAN